MAPVALKADILVAVDAGQLSMPLLLGLSAAFDTVHQKVLLPADPDPSSSCSSGSNQPSAAELRRAVGNGTSPKAPLWVSQGSLLSLLVFNGWERA